MRTAISPRLAMRTLRMGFLGTFSAMAGLPIVAGPLARRFRTGLARRRPEGDSLQRSDVSVEARCGSAGRRGFPVLFRGRFEAIFRLPSPGPLWHRSCPYRPVKGGESLSSRTRNRKENIMQIKPRARALAIPSAVVAVLIFLASCASTVVSEGGINLISADQEWSTREEMHAQVQREMRLVNDRSALDYLNTVGRRIAAQTPLGNRRWDFFIVDDSAVNAFNLPGGLVYVNSGLIAEADSLDELAGALAHEIGHGAARHGTQLMTRAYGYNLLASLALGRNPSQAQQIVAQLLGTGVL